MHSLSLSKSVQRVANFMINTLHLLLLLLIEEHFASDLHVCHCYSWIAKEVEKGAFHARRPTAEVFAYECTTLTY